MSESTSSCLTNRKVLIDLLAFTLRGKATADRVKALGRSASPIRLLMEKNSPNAQVFQRIATKNDNRKGGTYNNLMEMVSMDAQLRTCLQFLNDRLSVIRNERDTSCRLQLCVLWFEDITSLSLELKRTMESFDDVMSSSSSCALMRSPAFSMFVQLVRQALGTIMPSLLGRFDSLLHSAVYSIVYHVVDQRFRENRTDFSPARRWSGCSAWCASSSPANHADTTQALKLLFQTYCIVEMEGAINNICGQGNQNHAVLFSVSISAAVDALLNSILAHVLPIDIDGLQLLHQLLLGLQVLLLDTQKALLPCAAMLCILRSKEPVDWWAWKRAQLALKVLSEGYDHDDHSANTSPLLWNDDQLKALKAQFKKGRKPALRADQVFAALQLDIPER
jgi:hypothetical protein